MFGEGNLRLEVYSAFLSLRPIACVDVDLLVSHDVSSRCAMSCNLDLYGHSIWRKSVNYS